MILKNLNVDDRSSITVFNSQFILRIIYDNNFALLIFISHSMNMVYLEVIYDIQF